MINITHVDDDGKCAGAIVLFEFCIVPQQYSYIYYNYKAPIELDFDRLKNDPDKRVFITDVSLCEDVIDAIHTFLRYGWEVYHFDHHTATMRHPKREQFQNMDHVHTFYAEGICGAMLTWLYACMTEEERKNPYGVAYEFANGHTHVMINHREYQIPLALRYIDDNDVWRHENDETKYFCMGFAMYVHKGPDATLPEDPDKKLWEKLLYDTRLTVELVNKGRILYEYQEAQNERLCKSAFESYTLDGSHVCLCLNSIFGNSRIFGDKFYTYDFACKFGFDGNEWVYTLYSREGSLIDCCEIATKFGGGGHKHAAGFRTKEMILVPCAKTV